MMPHQPWQGGARQEGGGAPVKPPSPSQESECPICSNSFDPVRHVPKLLECLHTFCLQCLLQLHLFSAAGQQTGGREGTIACPLCRTLTVLPGGHAQNLLVNTKLAKEVPRSPVYHQQMPLETLASSPARPLPGQSDASLTPAITDGEAEVNSCCVQTGKACCAAILFLAAVVLGAMALYEGLVGFRPPLIPLSFFIILSVFCFLAFAFIACCPRNAPEGTRRRRVVSSGRHRFDDDQSWSASAAAWPSWTGHVESAWDGCQVDTGVTSGDSGFGGCHMDSGMSSGDCGFSECHTDSGMSSGDCGMDSCMSCAD